MALPPVDAAGFPSDEPALDPLVFPDFIPEGKVLPNIPHPKEDFPEWTTAPYNNVAVPVTFHDLIRLSGDPRDNPALYAAAVDTMRATNDYFWGQRGIDGYSLTQDRLEAMRAWLQENGHDNEIYPMPPDPRTLFVKEDVDDNPLDDGADSLWIQMFDYVQRMPDDVWEEALTWTRNDLEEDAARDGRGAQHLISHFFVRYMAWNEFISGDSVRSQMIQEDQQPSFDQLQEFFHRVDVAQNGVTFADICHNFHRARDTQMLLYRIEHFATLRIYPERASRTGEMEPVESRYLRKPDPTPAELDRLLASLANEGGFVTLFGLVNRYYPSERNIARITTALEAVALPDATGRNFVTMEAVDLIDAGDEDCINGITDEELRQRFTTRGWDLDRFRVWLEGYLYFDEEEGRLFPLYLREDNDDRETREESIRKRNRRRIKMTWDAATIQDDYRWDRDGMRYIQKERPDAAGEPDAEDSPTETDGSDAAAELPAPEAGPSSRTRGAKRLANGSSRPARSAKKARTGGRVQCSETTQAGAPCRRTKNGEPDEEWNCGLHGRRH